MSVLVVEVDGETRRLRPGQPPLTFGRDSTCTVSLTADDTGISRLAGRIEHNNGSWWIKNLSRKRPLHVIDNNGVAIPLLPEASGWPSPCRAVDETLIVLVAGELHRHRIILRPMGRLGHRQPHKPSDPVSTKNQPTPTDERQRAVLVALASGYLHPMPNYDPRPRSRTEVSEILRWSEQEVQHELSTLGQALRNEGIAGLQEEIDRKLCEWYIAMGHLRHADLRILPEYADNVVAPLLAITITQSVINEEIRHYARVAARIIAASLEPHLRASYGHNWLTTINQKYPSLRPSTLADPRYCLRVFVQDPASNALSTRSIRRKAWELRGLDNRATHNRPCTEADARRARHLHETIVAALSD